ncbi:LuxR family transcriptional regulator [Paenibacillus tarimensis]
MEDNRITVRELDYVVGREAELASFEQFMNRKLRDTGIQPQILHIHGTGGTGKSTFLRQCVLMAQHAGLRAALLDSRDFVHTEQGILEALIRHLRAGMQTEENLPSGALSWPLLSEQLPSNGERLILAFDTFEEMKDMEAWMRDRLLPWLPAGVLVLLAGRYPLQGAWLHSPAWRERLQQIELQPLNRQACSRYFQLCGITGERDIERLWRQTRGHALSMSLAAASHAHHPGPLQQEGMSWFDEVVYLWLQEVPDEDLRRHIEAASVLRVFNQEMLSFIMDEQIPSGLFDRLISLSYVRKSDRGWQLHDLMRETTEARLRERQPSLHKKLRERAASYYAEAILQSSLRSSTGWEVGELFRFAGNKIARALTSEQSGPRYYWETVTESSLPEALAYLEWRKHNHEPITGIEIDPETGTEYQIHYSAEEVRYNSSMVDVEAIFALDPSGIKLLRDQQGEAAAMAVTVPFHQGTISWLREHPLVSPFLSTLSDEEIAKLATPADHPSGWFMLSYDFKELLNPAVRTEGVYLIYSFMCRGGIVVTSPFPNDITKKVYPAFGFVPVPGAEHTHYDRKTLTPTYILDTRGDNLRSFIDQHFHNAGLQWNRPPSKQTPAPPSQPAAQSKLLKQLTKRELEVVKLVAAGLSNAETAQQLYVSEATVKKHLIAIFAKLGITRRIQLVSMIQGLPGFISDEP